LFEFVPLKITSWLWGTLGRLRKERAPTQQLQKVLYSDIPICSFEGKCHESKMYKVIHVMKFFRERLQRILHNELETLAAVLGKQSSGDIEAIVSAKVSRVIKNFANVLEPYPIVVSLSFRIWIRGDLPSTRPHIRDSQKRALVSRRMDKMSTHFEQQCMLLIQSKLLIRTAFLVF